MYQIWIHVKVSPLIFWLFFYFNFLLSKLAVSIVWRGSGKALTWGLNPELRRVIRACGWWGYEGLSCAKFTIEIENGVESLPEIVTDIESMYTVDQRMV